MQRSNHTAFSPAASARRVAPPDAVLRISLGCEGLRMGDEPGFAALLLRMIAAGPVRLSARQSVVIDGTADADAARLAEAMGGTVTQGAGTTRIALPFPQIETSEVARACPLDTRLVGLRLLVADDSATNRLVLSEMLAAAGAEVSTAESGFAAVALAGRSRFDLLLLDISMPGMEGVEALAAIRAGGCTTPALAVTANAMAHQIAEYIAGGFDGHLAKPLRQDDLVARVAGLTR